MLITYNGHSEFLLETGNVFRILTDPYDSHVGYKMTDEKADCVLVSHQHADHNYVAKVKGEPVVVSTPGVYSVGPGVTVTAIESDHDDVMGSQRGKTLLFVVEAEGLRVAHLGDLGRNLNENEIKALGRIDILMIPVGGFFTIYALTAREIVRKLNPNVVIPMHYRTSVNASWPIDDVKKFMGAMDALEVQPMPLVRITAGDLRQQPPVCLLQPKNL